MSASTVNATRGSKDAPITRAAGRHRRFRGRRARLSDESPRSALKAVRSSGPVLDGERPEPSRASCRLTWFLALSLRDVDSLGAPTSACTDKPRPSDVRQNETGPRSDTVSLFLASDELRRLASAEPQGDRRRAEFLRPFPPTYGGRDVIVTNTSMGGLAIKWKDSIPPGP
jgi:hypothetical protein